MVTCLQLSLRYWTPGCLVRTGTLGDSLSLRLGIAAVCRWILWGSPSLIRGHVDTVELYFESVSSWSFSFAIFCTSPLFKKKQLPNNISSVLFYIIKTKPFFFVHHQLGPRICLPTCAGLQCQVVLYWAVLPDSWSVKTAVAWLSDWFVGKGWLINKENKRKWKEEDGWKCDAVRWGRWRDLFAAKDKEGRQESEVGGRRDRGSSPLGQQCVFWGWTEWLFMQNLTGHQQEGRCELYSVCVCVFMCV